MSLILSAALFFSISPFDSASFYNSVIGDFSRSSYYLSFDVQFSDYKGRVIIENDDIYSFLNANDTLTRDEYKIIINRMLADRKFDFRRITFPNKGFVKVVYRDDITGAASKGRVKFLNIFFKKNVVRGNVDHRDYAAVVDRLFNWGILAKHEDESGVLIIRQL